MISTDDRLAAAARLSSILWGQLSSPVSPSILASSTFDADGGGRESWEKILLYK